MSTPHRRHAPPFIDGGVAAAIAAGPLVDEIGQI